MPIKRPGRDAQAKLFGYLLFEPESKPFCGNLASTGLYDNQTTLPGLIDSFHSIICQLIFEIIEVYQALL